jgi:dipeptidyl aminopeptidase/acylaminoacyl peptidase
MTQLASRVLVIVALLAPAGAARADSAYEKPAKDILDVMHAPPPPRPLLSPSKDRLLLAHWTRYDRISDNAEPMLRLGGARVNPRNNAFHGVPYNIGLSLRKLSDPTEKSVALPAGARIRDMRWNAAGTRVAFSNTTATAVELWVLDAESGRARRVPGLSLNPMLQSHLQWMADGKTLLVKAVPRDRRAPPTPPAVPPGPRIEDSAGGAGASSTYEVRDVLKGPHDADLFDYYGTSQLALVDAASGKVSRLAKPAVLGVVSPAPGGRHILIERLTRPYSYQRTYWRFPREVEIWGLDGQPIERLASLPLAEQVPIDGVQVGPRDHEWRTTEPATLMWIEALDGGDPRKKVPHRDRVMLKAMAGTPVELCKTEHRFVAAQWIEGGTQALILEHDRDRRWNRAFLFDLPTSESARPTAGRLVWDMSADERYRNPGFPVYKTLPNGRGAVLRHQDFIYFAGQGASPQGDRPFLDRLNLKTLVSERLFRSQPGSLEAFVDVIDPAAGTFLTRRESLSEPPNLQLRTLAPGAGQAAPGESAWTSRAVPVTRYPDPTPQIRSIQQKLVTYKRADGIPLSFTMYLPPDYKPGTRLPTMLWAYPLDYADRATAGQIEGSADRFVTIQGTSPLFFLLRGYAVLMNVAMPVVGPPRTVYDSFVEQITANAKAAIDKGVELGVVDPDRVGVAGHSHGALMTANLLAHTDLFRAGIARSGAYNHTSRPFGFQNEKRTLWEAREVYTKLSPVIQADKIEEPLLLIHGEVDANPGTVPFQSEKLFEALRGVGGTVRLVMLPHESHGYTARESIEHVVFEMLSWFDKHVKNAKPRAPKAITASK